MEIKEAGIEDDFEVTDEMIDVWDNVHGESLLLDKLQEARNGEIKFMQDKKMWDVKPVSECWQKTGRAPISVRWVDTNKGDLISMLIRSKLVARDFKGDDKNRDDLLAATTPLEAKRLLFSRAATRRSDGRKRKLMLIDVKKAHLNPPCKEDVYIELPSEVGAGPGVCGKLSYWIYRSGVGRRLCIQIRRSWFY